MKNVDVLNCVNDIGGGITSEDSALTISGGSISGNRWAVAACMWAPRIRQPPRQATCKPQSCAKQAAATVGPWGSWPGLSFRVSDLSLCQQYPILPRSLPEPSQGPDRRRHLLPVRGAVGGHLHHEHNDGKQRRLLRRRWRHIPRQGERVHIAKALEPLSSHQTHRGAEAGAPDGAQGRRRGALSANATPQGKAPDRKPSLMHHRRTTKPWSSRPSA